MAHGERKRAHAAGRSVGRLAVVALGTAWLLTRAPAAWAAASVRERFILLARWSDGEIALVTALAAAVVAFSLYNYRGLRPWRLRLGLLALRMAALAALVLVALQPALERTTVARSRDTVAVLVDTSASMALPYDEAPRLDLVRRQLTAREAWWARLAAHSDLRFFTFGDKLRPTPRPLAGPAAGGARDLAARAPQTRLADALVALPAAVEEAGGAHDGAGSGLAGVLVFTDGIDTSPAGRAGTLGAPLEAALDAIDAPVSIWSLGADASLRDVAVVDVSVNPFAFVLNAATLDATVTVHGYGLGQVEVRLTEDGETIATQRLNLLPGTTRYPVRFEFVPRALGKRVYGVHADVLPGEVYRPNNARQVVVQVLRDKIRVLQIVGQPSWDERALRSHLKRDPDVDLVSFFILVNRDSVRPLDPNETSLIPFPARELFEDQLGGFDLVIFQNFNYGPFATRRYLPKVVEYVRQGGAFLMVGGPLSFASGGYQYTELADVLPVELPEGGDAGLGLVLGAGSGRRQDPLVDTSPFHAALTDAGRTHAVTRLRETPVANAALWESLGPLEGVNLSLGPAPGATTLLTHPTLKTPAGAPLPVMAVRAVEEGRTMAVLTDSTWQWRFVDGNAGRDARLYDALWSNAIRWLIKDPALDLVRARARRDEIPVGGAAKVDVDVFRADYRPADDLPVEVWVRLQPLGGARDAAREVLHRADLRTDGRGRLTLEVPVTRAGVYRVTVRAAPVAGRVEEGGEVFIGTDRSPEMRDVVGDGRLVEAIVGATGGALRSLSALDDAPPPVRPPRVARVTARSRRDLWNAPWALLLVVALLAGEWWLRRRHGYL